MNILQNIFCRETQTGLKWHEDEHMMTGFLFLVNSFVQKVRFLGWSLEQMDNDFNKWMRAFFYLHISKAFHK